jgi:hypothetical protein
VSGRVIFLNTLYYPDYEEYLRLEEIQRHFDYYHAEIAYQSRDFDETKKKIFKESSHRNMRKRLVIVKDECQG